MKDDELLLRQWMVTGILVMILAFLPRIGVADEVSLKLSSEYKQALQLLEKRENSTGNESSLYRTAGMGGYLRKKLEYNRFLDAYIKEKRQELAAEGVSVSVISKNDLLFLKGYGHADKETQTEVTPFTLFRVGSVSKVFTGIAIMQLVEQGKIDLDAPLENYLPGFGYKTHYPDADPITVRTLMTHQSGLVGDILNGSTSVSELKSDFRDLVNLFNDEYVAYPSGYISSYSNSAVSLLGIVIEEVSGIEFSKYVKNNICWPIGMIATNFSLHDFMRPLLADSYNSEGVENPFLYIRDEPAGSLISNSLEMSLFMRMILNGGKLLGQRILKESTLEQMLVQQNSDIELDFPQDHGMKWGLSWALYHPTLSSLGKYVGHSGSVNDYYTQMHILPDHGLAVIVETNAQIELSTDVADMAMLKALEIFKGIKRSSAQSLPPIVPLAQNHIQQTVGNYATNHLGLLTIYANNHRLFAVSSAQGVMEFELKPHADNWFSLYQNNQPAPGYENLRITIKNGKRERFVGVQYYDTNGVIISSPEGSEYEIPDELPPEWLDRVGWYSVINGGDSEVSSDPVVSIQVLQPGVLSYAVIADSTTVLDALYEDEAIRRGRGRNINETIQIVDCNAEECLNHLGFLLKKQPDTTLSTYSRKVVSSDDQNKKGKEIEKMLMRRSRFY
jgi:CubicO group peptidase (beta-lactamase class C family)